MSDNPIIKPQPISGFPEWLPEEKLVEERLLRIIREEFERYGFTPIETPAVERKEVLSAKGVVEKEIYALSRLAAGEGEDPSTEMALHFDLTVPLARYVAQHFGKLTFPFRRYQIQKVWRGERPQAGRFREFHQCDIDIVGNNSLSALNDAEIPCVIHAIFSRIGIGRFVIRINNRKVLQGLLEHYGVAPAHYADGLRAVDSLEKIGRDAVARELAAEAGMEPGKAAALLDALTGEADLEALKALAGDTGLLADGLADLEEVSAGLKALGVPPDCWRIDLTIARGLDYYTGTVYETQLVDHPEVGSICSGGRYDDLASNYTRQKLPGVGISIGLTRLLSRLFDAGLLKPAGQTPAAALVTVMDRAHLDRYLAIASTLRAAGLNIEVYTERKKLGDQLKYADKKGFPAAIIIGEDEFSDGTALVKNLRAGSQDKVRQADLPTTLKALIASGEG